MKSAMIVAAITAIFVAAGSPPSVDRDSNVNPGCGRDDKPSYVGADSCKKCHFKQFTSWKKTPMAKAFDLLKPDQAAEAKGKYKLDPKKDYTKDAKCVACHTTGYGLAGGYPAIVEGKAWTEEETKRAATMENVQCESCHGPGSLTGPYKKDNEKFAKADVLKLGMIEPTEENCKTCHNDKGATYDKDRKWDYATFIKDQTKVHQHVELKNKH